MVTTTLDLKVKLKDIAPCLKELQVQLPWEGVQTELEAVYRKLKGVARVPGFRIGHAPRDLLERYHGETAREETVQRLLQQSTHEALQAYPQLDLIGRPVVSEVNFKLGQPLSFVARLEIAPQVPLGRYKGLKLTRPKSEVSEETVKEMLIRLQDVHAELKPMLEPRAAAAGDFLLVDLTEKKPGAPASLKRDVVIHLDLEKDPQGILKGLVGLNPGQERSIDLPKGGSAKVVLKEIKQKETVALDDAFARTVGSYETLEALKQAIREDLKRQADHSAQQALRVEISRQLIDGWNFEVPPSLVASQARRIMKERAIELMNQGIPLTEVETKTQVLSDQAKVAALREVKQFFILRRIATNEGITTSEQEMNERIQLLAKQMQTSADKVREDLESKDLMEELAWNIIRSKVIDLILKEAQ